METTIAQRASSINGNSEHPTRCTKTTLISAFATKPAVTVARSSTNWAGRSPWIPSSVTAQPARSYMVRHQTQSFHSMLALIEVLGAPFQWAAIFHKEDINFTHGHHDLGWYESSEKTCVHKLPCKVSCAYCRTPIMDEGRNMILLFPTLINFKSPEDRKNFEITWASINPGTMHCTWLIWGFNHSCHMFYPRRVLDIPDGKPKWTGISNESELIEDSPKEAKEDLKRKREEKEWLEAWMVSPAVAVRAREASNTTLHEYWNPW